MSNRNNHKAYVFIGVLLMLPAAARAQEQRLPVDEGEEVCGVTLPIETFRVMLEETVQQGSSLIDCVDSSASLHLENDFTTSDDDYFILDVEGRGTIAVFCDTLGVHLRARLRFIPGGTAAHSPADLEYEFSCARQPMWAYNSSGWFKIVPDASPPLRGDFAMVHMPGQGLLLYGGRGNFPGFFGRDDMWAYNDQKWVKFEGATPPKRYQHSMAYDSARGRIVLFGGFDDQALGGLADTWEFDGSDWTNVTPATAPVHRGGHVMAYDSHRQRIVLFGGLSDAVFLGETWEFDGSDWTNVTPASSPPARTDAAMVYDEARQRMVLFGGQTAYIGGYAADTWEYDGSQWTQVTTAAAPSPRVRHAMAYDPDRQVVVIFGGRTAPGTGPGGSVVDDTWEFDGSSWAAGGPNPEGCGSETDSSMVSTAANLARRTTLTCEDCENPRGNSAVMSRNCTLS